MEKNMVDPESGALSMNQLVKVLDKTPAGITVIDKEGHILYYNEYCAKFVDRKPEYIGKNISFCHQKSESMVKIKKILSELNEGKKKEFYYEAKRGEDKLGVTVSPFVMDGKQIGFIQCFSIVR
ncbi:MAG: PAS domain-containing protein [Desulfobacterales bacterium]